MDASTSTLQRPALTSSATNASNRSSHSGHEQQGGVEPVEKSSSSAAGPFDYFGASSNASFDNKPFNMQTSTSTPNGASQHPWANLFGSQALPTSSLHGRPSTHEQASASSKHQDAQMPSFANKFAMRRVQSGGSSNSVASGSSSVAASTEDFSKFSALKPSELIDMLRPRSSDRRAHDEKVVEGSVLVIDIRPSTSFSLARIHGSVNVCAPSTLLRRTGVTVERIEEEMLTSEDDQARFSGWRKGPRKGGMNSSKSNDDVSDRITPIMQIIVLDTDTQHITSAGRPAAGGGGPCLAGLLRKFDQAGFDGGLYWLVGGFEAFSLYVKESLKQVESSVKAFISSIIEETTVNQDSRKKKSVHDGGRRSSVPNTQNVGKIELRSPPFANSRTKSLVQPMGLPKEAFTSSSTARGKNVSLSQAVSHEHESEAFKLDNAEAEPHASTMSAANPFFDNIRQNRELQNGVTEHIPLAVPEMNESEAKRLPDFLSKLRAMNESERAGSLAQAFYDVEKEERDRLMDTMQRHADESDCKRAAQSRDRSSPSSQQLSSEFCAVSPGGDGPASLGAVNFPFSIAAALERGGENRYNNIWTYEHSRVRCPKSADYLNGSYIEPARMFGCQRRYIATQAPLPSTFDTFWSVVWQQNVRTICMVTREFESGRIQSHNYWTAKQYGKLRVEVIEELALDKQGDVIRSIGQVASSAEDQKSTECSNYFDMGPQDSQSQNDDYATIQRRLWLINETGDRRMITQFQYIAWPDYSVPDDAGDLLTFLRLASRSQHAAELEAKKDMLDDSTTPAISPLVVHCSAGVGRTGTYILIDSVLDVLRRRRWAQAGRAELDVWDAGESMFGRSTRVRNGSMSSASSDNSSIIKINGQSQSARSIGNSSTSSGQFQRRNLKRELSPSAMDLDSRDNVRISMSPSKGGTENQTENGRDLLSRRDTVNSPRNVDSPPPAQRSRAEESEEPTLKAFSSSPSSVGSMAVSGYPTHLPFSAMGPDGPQTPSTALGRLSLSSSHSTPSRTRHNSSQSSTRSGALPPVDEVAKRTRGSSAAEKVQSDLMNADGTDLIRAVLHTIREQRMSMVQTTRQFVFAYHAIFIGMLEEMRSEDVSLGRRRGEQG